MDKKPIPFKFHPRVFNSLGTDLVTDDIVAIIELIKNSYDALATEVIIKFSKDSSKNYILEIADDGIGMTKDIIENVWFTVATPYKELHPEVKKQGNSRRVTGEKGLGRLSISRLGNNLEMYTKSESNPCWLITLNWKEISTEVLSNQALGYIQETSSIPGYDYTTGTLLRITGISENWESLEKLEDLRNNLSRFLSPFTNINNFKIKIKHEILESEEEITPPEYLNYPIYCIKGDVNNAGAINYTFKYDNGEACIEETKEIIPTKEINFDLFNLPESFCGPFDFELRVWEVDKENTELFQKRFNINKKSDLFDQISYHKGISVYRDGVLVLPKTDNSRDWLGLDLRRISRIGQRISNRQIIGYISISGERNPQIIDASNREGFKENKETKTFRKYLQLIVKELEYLRENKRYPKSHQEPPFDDILDSINPQKMREKVEDIVKSNGTMDDVLTAVKDFETASQTAHDQIEKRAYYYSRLASIGTISALLIHEIRNRTGQIAYLHKKIRKNENSINCWDILEKPLIDAESSTQSLESLADRFAPLAIQTVNKQKKVCNPYDEFNTTINVLSKDIAKYNIQIIEPKTTQLLISIYPGELNTIYINLLSNSIFWLISEPSTEKIIELEIKTTSTSSTVQFSFHDSGPGIPDGMEDRIFWPGITRRKNGFGMGLTVASELVAQNGGKMILEKPGKLGGATFSFTLKKKV